MAGVLGLGDGGASALNQEIIDKLKDADKAATVDPIDKKINAITSYEKDEEGEQYKLVEIKLKVSELITSMRLMDLNTTTGTVFDAKSSSVSGTSATFASDNMSLLSEGITKVNVTQVAQKDIYQTDTFSSKDVQVVGGNDVGDLVTIAVADTPIYQSDKTSSATSTDLVGEGTFTITPADGSAVTFTTTDTTTWAGLKTMIDADSTLTASFVNNRLSITSIDGTKELSIADTSGSVTATLGISSGSKFTTEGQTYTQLASSINANGKINASVEQVGDNTYRLVIKSNETGEANLLTVSGTGVDLGLGSVASKTINDFDQLMTAGKLTINGDVVISDTEDMSYNALIDEINNYNGGGTYTATKVDNQIVINANDGSNINIVEAGSNELNFINKNHTATAKNMNATVDGVNYDLSSNTLTTVGGLKITATTTGESSLSISENTDLVMPAVDDFTKKYNELVDMIDKEVLSADSTMKDTSSIKLMMSDIKAKIFNSYGANSDKNIFNYGIALDKKGHLSVDTKIFAKALADDPDGIKELFVGDFTNEGLGTQLKSSLDALTSYGGLLTKYDENITARLEKLNEEKEKAVTLLNEKYAMMATSFAAYGAMITQMESAFGGLKMMIDQSMSGN